MKLFIFYPAMFNVQSKFNRKIGNILKNVTNFDLYCFHDNNGFIRDFINNNFPNTEIQIISELSNVEITHCIFFDDDEEFWLKHKNYIIKNNINYRYVKIRITRVVNIEKETQYKGLKSTASFEYIGRGSYWGNPYSMYDYSDEDKENSRDEVIRKFKYDFDYDKFPRKDKKEVYKLAGKRLGCFCKPAKCHGDVLADFLNSWDDGL